jgi:hypothetical protein
VWALRARPGSATDRLYDDNVRSVFVADERVAGSSDIVNALTIGGYAVAANIDDPSVVAVVVAPRGDAGSLPDCARGTCAAAVPVVVFGTCPTAEMLLQSAIDGAVRWTESADLLNTLAAILGDESPDLPEMQRRARVAALESFARAQAESRLATGDARWRVHLTRLEHNPVRDRAPAPAAMSSRFSVCTSHQRELLAVISREGSVTKAAVVLGASRSTVYASLRRIAHRVGLSDSTALLELIKSS